MKVDSDSDTSLGDADKEMLTKEMKLFHMTTNAKKAIRMMDFPTAEQKCYDEMDNSSENETQNTKVASAETETQHTKVASASVTNGGVTKCGSPLSGDSYSVPSFLMTDASGDTESRSKLSFLNHLDDDDCGDPTDHHNADDELSPSPSPTSDGDDEDYDDDRRKRRRLEITESQKPLRKKIIKVKEKRDKLQIEVDELKQERKDLKSDLRDERKAFNRLRKENAQMRKLLRVNVENTNKMLNSFIGD